MNSIHTLNIPVTKPLTDAIENACRWLEDRQHPDGFWMGVLESNVCIEAEWLLALHFLGIKDYPYTQGLVQGILDEQRMDGAWEIYYDAPQGDISATVEAYAALRAYGMKPDDAPLMKARDWIFAQGGLTNIRVFTRYWLALIGEWPWNTIPIVPPEIIYLPLWFPFNIYNFASWARATMVPLSILSHRRPVRPLPDSSKLNELFPKGRSATTFKLPKKGSVFSWSGFFMLVDRLLHVYHKWGITPGRERAIKICLEWIIRHQDSDGTWGGIQPPWIYSLLALHTEGYPLSHPVLHKGIGVLDTHWSYERHNGVHIQASESPVWDTLLSLFAMQECQCDYRQSSGMQRAVKWLLENQVKVPGSWQVKAKKVAPGGWAFEHANRMYPDVDDTALALIVLSRWVDEHENPKDLSDAIHLAKNWILGLQSHNGGWAAFDKDNDMELLTKIPFCDFGEVLDPPSVDVTAHVIEGLGYLGMTLDHPAIARGVDFIRSEQEAEGSWFGRWGVNHLYGTGAVLPALKAVGEDMEKDYILKAAEWIVSRQNSNGGWGECCGSYMNKELWGKGESTASQSAWAIMALLAVNGSRYRQCIERGIDYLLHSQKQDTWDEPQYTGTGFPGYAVGSRIHLTTDNPNPNMAQGTELSRGFMINYNLYRHYFPLIALGRFRRFCGNC